MMLYKEKIYWVYSDDQHGIDNVVSDRVRAAVANGLDGGNFQIWAMYSDQRHIASHVFSKLYSVIKELQ